MFHRNFVTLIVAGLFSANVMALDLTGTWQGNFTCSVFNGKKVNYADKDNTLKISQTGHELAARDIEFRNPLPTCCMAAHTKRDAQDQAENRYTQKSFSCQVLKPILEKEYLSVAAIARCHTEVYFDDADSLQPHELENEHGDYFYRSLHLL